MKLTTVETLTALPGVTSDQYYEVHDGKQKSRNVAPWAESSMTVSISTSTTKNMELEPRSTAGVTKAGVENSDFCRQHWWQKIKHLWEFL